MTTATGSDFIILLASVSEQTARTRQFRLVKMALKTRRSSSNGLAMSTVVACSVSGLA
jgi:hypothetical protein